MFPLIVTETRWLLSITDLDKVLGVQHIICLSDPWHLYWMSETWYSNSHSDFWKLSWNKNHALCLWSFEFWPFIENLTYLLEFKRLSFKDTNLSVLLCAPVFSHLPKQSHSFVFYQILASSKWWPPNFCQISDFICLLVAILLPTKGILRIDMI